MINEPQQTKRRYRSPLRDAAAAGTRERVLDAAVALLREIGDISGFTLEAVAKAAGVARLTVYNQFGSRLSLIEAMFDRIADLGGLVALSDAMELRDPEEAIGEIVRIFCTFWGNDPAVQRLNDTIMLDPEIERSVAARHERRRGLLTAIIERASPGAAAQARRDTVDLLFLLTAPQTFRALLPGRALSQVCDLLRDAALDALHRLKRSPPRA